MICNWCNKELKQCLVNIYQCTCTSLGELLNKKPDGVSICYVEIKNDKIVYYDIFTKYKNKFYNIESSNSEGILGLSETNIYLVGENGQTLASIYECRFVPISKENGINEALDFFNRIMQLKAFV